ncbi:SAV_2336 N-terminal domain-related protein [Streptomyces sp. 2-1]|uniref:SAV_2336 N-terminal domain-related protein n=1 Tax=Streptomyces sp. 2-1 TaxID=412710 RepID=UPI003AFAB979
MIEELFAAFEDSGANAGPEELAEILWLAARIDGTGIRRPGHPSPAPHDERGQQSRALEPSSTRARDSSPAEQFYSAADMADTPGSAVRRVDSVRIRRAASLHDSLAVMRALRPLGRHAGLPGDVARGELDEELTVRSTIEQCLPVPVFRPRRGRWLDLALVVDAHHSMLLWHDLVTELRRVFVQTGIFRDVRTWYLHGTGRDEAPTVAREGGEPRSVQEVADPSGHRMVLVITDTVAGGWSASGVQDVLRQWASHGPVALLNVLPRRLWDRGAIRPQPHMIRAPRPAAPNASWRLGQAAGSRRKRRSNALAEGIAVPVVEASAGSISALAELVAGGGRWSRLPCLTIAQRPGGPTEPQSQSGPPLEPPVTVDEILRRFRAGASPVAQTLAGYLSAVPLTLPVMNLVRQIMLPESDPGHLAEVALGGLFESWERDVRKGPTDMARMPFHIRAGVQEALLGSQRRDEITTVQELVRREMGAAVVPERGSGPAGDFLAARGTPGGDGGQALSLDALPFADRASTPSPVGLPVREAQDPNTEHLPGYIERDVDAQLGNAIAQAINGRSSLVLVVGEPGSGKTHATARAIQEMPDDWRLWSPDDVSLTLARGAPQVGPRTIVLLDDLQRYTTISGSFIESMAHTVLGMIEDSERAPILIIGTLTPSAWDNLMAPAQGGPADDYASLRHLISRAEVIRVSPVAAAPQRWPGEPSHTRLVMIAGTGDPPRPKSSFQQVGTGFLLGPRLVLTDADAVSRHSRSWTVRVRNRLGTVTSDGWVDCRVLWIDNTYGAALLLAEDDLAEPSTDSHFSAPRWARLTGDEPLSPCHATGVIVTNETSPQTSGYLTGILHPTSSFPGAAYDFEPAVPLSQSRNQKSLARGLSGAPVFFGELLLGFVSTMRHDRSGHLRLAVTAISALANSPDFTDICSQYMRRIPRVDLLPARPPVQDGDRTSDASAGRRRQRVFISYAHENDDGAHAEQVRNLVEVLRAANIDVRVDPGELKGHLDWAAGVRHEMEAADVILVIASPAYKRHADDPRSDSDRRVDVASEARLLRDEVAHGPTRLSQRILPVILPGSTSEDLPVLLRPLRPLAVDAITGAGVDQLLYRLAQYSPATDLVPWQPDTIAHSLITQSDQLADTGSTGEALAAAREAVSVAERPAQADPDSMRPVLAMALSTLSNRLAENGEREEALATAEQAVMIRQQLADTDPTRSYDLARSLSNLSNRLADLGRHQEALSTINDAIGLCRQLADTDPGTFLPDLATMLNNQGAALAETGQTTEALNAISEAVGIWRQLAEADPDAAAPGLASALLNLGSALSETERYAEALSTAEEAVFLYRTLAENSPGTPSPRLATALHHLSLRLTDIHRWDEALTKVEEAIAVRRRLSATNPEAFLPDLAQSLSAAAWLRTSQRQELDRALDQAKEAVEILSRFVAQQPTRFTDDLRQALSVQAETLNALGRSAEATRIRSHAPSSATAGEPAHETRDPTLTNLAPPSLDGSSRPGTPDELRALVTGARAVLFDFDGPICRLFAGYQAERVANALVEWLEEQGLRGLLTEVDRAHPDPQMVLRAVNRRHPHSDLMVELEERLTQEELRASATAMPTAHAEPVIRTWAAVGARLAVVTNNSPRVVKTYLADRHLTDCFAPYIFGRTFDLSQLKPAPGLVTRALTAMDTPPSKALMIGDSPSDFIASQEADVAFLGYARNEFRERHLREIGVQVIVPSLEPVLAILRDGITPGSL